MTTFGVVTDVLGGCAIVAAGITTYFVLSRPGDAAAGDVKVGLGPGGAVLRGSF